VKRKKNFRRERVKSGGELGEMDINEVIWGM
jgi:hypothetical protein